MKRQYQRVKTPVLLKKLEFLQQIEQIKIIGIDITFVEHTGFLIVPKISGIEEKGYAISDKLFFESNFRRGNAF